MFRFGRRLYFLHPRWRRRHYGFPRSIQSQAGTERHIGRPVSANPHIRSVRPSVDHLQPAAPQAADKTIVVSGSTLADETDSAVCGQRTHHGEEHRQGSGIHRWTRWTVIERRVDDLRLRCIANGSDDGYLVGLVPDLDSIWEVAAW